MISIVGAIQDPALFGPWFRGPTWRPWIAFLKALFGLSMTKDEKKIFQSGTRSGRIQPVGTSAKRG